MSGQNFIETEGGLIIELEGTGCRVETDVDCHMLCRDVTVDSGSFTIVNACTLPITVTGFTVSDSGRFSLVEYPKYTGSGVYPSGEVPELPIPFTLKPRGKKKINTFFHPYFEELESGNAGTMINRTGDKFGATVQIYPGFPILNCTGKSDCDASVILSGEFICDDKEEDREWMKNEDNFITPEDLSDGIPIPPSDPDSSDPPSFTYDPQGCNSVWMDGNYRVMHPNYNTAGVLITTDQQLILDSQRFGYDQLQNFPDYPGQGNSFRMSNVTAAQTYTFSEPVENPVLALYSLGDPSTTVTITCSVAPHDYSGGASTVNPSWNLTINSGNKTIAGTEGYGMILFPGIHSSITLTPNIAENYYNLVWGIRYCGSDPCAGFSLAETHVGNTEWQGGNGSIDIAVNGGSGTYTYLWSNGATTQDISSLSSGVYTLTVTDTNNCTANISVTIEELAQGPTNNFSLAAGNCGTITSASTGVSKSVSDIMIEMGIASAYGPNHIAFSMDPSNVWSYGGCSYLGSCEGWELGFTVLNSDINGCTADQGPGSNYEQSRLKVLELVNEGFTNGTINW